MELIRFLQVAQTLTVHHGALAYLLGINALRASEAAAVHIEDYADTLRGHRVLHLVGKGNKPATMPWTPGSPPCATPRSWRRRRLERHGSDSRVAKGVRRFRPEGASTSGMVVSCRAR